MYHQLGGPLDRPHEYGCSLCFFDRRDSAMRDDHQCDKYHEWDVVIYLASSFLVDPRARSQRGLWSFALRIVNPLFSSQCQWSR